jgi:hypothetical protein
MCFYLQSNEGGRRLWPRGGESEAVNQKKEAWDIKAL